ncbi:uncharacterized protein JCM6883_005724 [Sporobolomyces salmoneus]|uniref:uncharacterized protein n=1 Tax=Sporobolomyces salmoneus TaxID=183962 RepID=UPI0031801229
MVRPDPPTNESSISLPLLAPSTSASYPPLPASTSSRRPPLRRVLLKLSLPAALFSLVAFLHLNFFGSTDNSLRGAALTEWIHRNGSNVNVFDRLEIEAEDRSAKAVFIALGASLNEFHVKDRDGKFRDVVVGYSDPHSALNESNYAYFGSIVGRYANRISQSSFTDPFTNETFHLPINEGESTTLHGGRWGYSKAGWKVESHGRSYIIFSLLDQGAEGFPGTVKTIANYTLLSSPTRLVSRFESEVLSPSPVRTPISLSSHVYWNLDGYASEAGKGVGGGMKLWIDANRTVRVDERLIPTGELVDVEVGGPLDFYSNGEGVEKELIDALEDERSRELCGKDCDGLDNALIFSKPERDFERDVVMSLSSIFSGIRLKVRTNQPLVHLYSCNSPSFSSTTGDYPFKPTQNNGEIGTYGHHSCLAVEQEGWIDGLHHEKEWDLKREKSQWYDSERKYEWWAEYEFETF